MNRTERTHDTIDALTEQLDAVTIPMMHPALRASLWAGASLLYIIGITLYLGIRPDLSDKIADPAFLFEMMIAVLIFTSAALSASVLCIPDMRGQRWLPFVPVGGTVLIVLWSVFRAWTEGLALPALHWDHCFQDAALVGTVPAAFLIFLSTRGASTRPYMTATMNGLAVGSAGYIALRLTCTVDTVGHSFVYHLVPFVVFGGALALLARRVFRW